MEKRITGIKNLKIVEWMNSKVGKIVMGTIAYSLLGIALPRVFHLLAGSTAGVTFLPMHIAVLMAAMTFGVVSGSVVAGTSIIMSYLLTGMPTVEKLPFMLIELFLYAIILGMTHKKMNSYLALVVTMVLGRILYAGVILIASQGFGIPMVGISSVGQAIQNGIPGLVIQLLCIPFIVKMIKKGIQFDD